MDFLFKQIIFLSNKEIILEKIHRFFSFLHTKCVPKPNPNSDPRTEVHIELWADCNVASLID